MQKCGENLHNTQIIHVDKVIMIALFQMVPFSSEYYEKFSFSFMFHIFEEIALTSEYVTKEKGEKAPIQVQHKYEIAKALMLHREKLFFLQNRTLYRREK